MYGGWIGGRFFLHDGRFDTRALDHRNHLAFAHLVTDCDTDLQQFTGDGRRHFHRSFVRFDDDQRIIGRDLRTNGCKNFDDLDVFSVANVGNADFLLCHC